MRFFIILLALFLSLDVQAGFIDDLFNKFILLPDVGRILLAQTNSESWNETGR